MAHSEARLFPALLRHWRTRRGLSQLDLALAADVSPRHVSFLETARAQPSREMVLRLGAALGVRLRDQNDMLRAAGFPDQFSEPRLEDGLPPGVAQAIERMLSRWSCSIAIIRFCEPTREPRAPLRDWLPTRQRCQPVRTCSPCCSIRASCGRSSSTGSVSLAFSRRACTARPSRGRTT